VGFAEPPPAKKRSEARERLLAAASLMFYAEGINSAGIERIIKEGQVTLAAFYRHSPARSTWSSPTCTVRTTIFAARATEQAETLQGRDLVRAVGDDVTSRILQAAFRGCAFLNAVWEFEDRRALSAWSSPSTASGITSSSVEPSKTPATNFPPTPPVTS
jgi:hypothetical protein